MTPSTLPSSVRGYGKEESVIELVFHPTQFKLKVLTTIWQSFEVPD